MSLLCLKSVVCWQPLAFVIAASLLSGSGSAQSRCDETAITGMIFRAFPEADSTRRIVRDVGIGERRAIEAQLPFKVHFNELGEHTLHVAFRARRPLGVIYVRSEETEWGLTDVAWALTLDLRIHHFEFLGGRREDRDDLPTSRFGRQLIGRDLEHMLMLCSDRTSATMLAPPAGRENLAKVVVRSAAKALVVTGVVWLDQVEKLHDSAAGFDAFPSAARFPCQSGQFDLAIGDQVQVVQVKILSARTKTNHHLGAIVRTESVVGNRPLRLAWIVDRDSLVRRIEADETWPDKSLRLDCLALEGRLLGSAPAPNRLAPLAQGLSALLQTQLRGVQ